MPPRRPHTALDRRQAVVLVAVCVAEACVAIGLAAAFAALCTTIEVDPLDRVGQVSGLAAVQLRFALVAAAVLAMAAFVTRSTGSGVAYRLTVAGAAGLTTAALAGGVIVALHGTPWGLFAKLGDAGRIAEWADALVRGRSDPAAAHYPPLYLWIVGLYARIRDVPTGYASKDIAIAFTAAAGPVAYLMWRTLLSPLRALAVATVVAAVFVDPYKPHSSVALLLLPPLLVHVTRQTRDARDRPVGAVALRAAFTGVALGVVFVLYSGWFVWALPGMVAAFALSRPWAAGANRSATLVACLAGGFLIVAGIHLVDVLHASSVKDTYLYFDVYVDPAYVAMFRGDLPGTTGAWPPPGEIGGVGVFMLAVVGAAGVALVLRRSSAEVSTVALTGAGAWIVRMWLASRMYATGAVQLYPRTTSSVLCALLLLALFALFAVYDSTRARIVEINAPRDQDGANEHTVLVGALFVALVVAASAGSATADRYQPKNDNSLGQLAYQSHVTPLVAGGCPRFARSDTCSA